ncbi:tail protein X [Shewanella sp.]|uniref:tail protein X n=1 Tax=Shewanella sp. TaxID=50422 RepID=UPI00356ADB0B
MQVRARQGDTVDAICQRHLRCTAEVTEKTLELNPGLAELGPVIPQGTLIVLPEVTASPRKTMIQLWD